MSVTLLYFIHYTDTCMKSFLYLHTGCLSHWNQSSSRIGLYLSGSCLLKLFGQEHHVDMMGAQQTVLKAN